MTEEDDLRQAVDRVLAGDTDSFSIIVRECESSVRVFLSARLRNATQVDDLTQETFIACYQGLGSFHRERDFQAWLMGIAKHKLGSFLRKAYSAETHAERLRRTVFDEVETKLMERSSEYIRDKTERLSFCLEKLAQRVRTMMVARYYDGERVQAIAEREGLEPNAVSALLLRGRKQLETCLRSGTPLQGVGNE